MNKKTILYILLELVFLAVFNTVFFVGGGTEHTASVWISYGFIHFSYLMILATPFLIKENSSASVFGFSLYSISTAYFFTEFIVGIVFILIGSESYKAALLVQVIIAGIYAILLISNLIANESTAESVERKEEEVSYIKTGSSKLKTLIGKLDDKKANKEIEKVYDLLHSSPTRTITEVHSLEVEIKNKISELEGVVDAKNNDAAIKIAGELLQVIEERNRKIRLNQ